MPLSRSLSLSYSLLPFFLGFLPSFLHPSFNSSLPTNLSSLLYPPLSYFLLSLLSSLFFFHGILFLVSLLTLIIPCLPIFPCLSPSTHLLCCVLPILFPLLSPSRPSSSSLPSQWWSPPPSHVLKSETPSPGRPPDAPTNNPVITSSNAIIWLGIITCLGGRLGGSLRRVHKECLCV